MAVDGGILDDADRRWLDDIGALCDGGATAEQQRNLAERLWQDPEARRAYVRYIDLHLSLLEVDDDFQLAALPAAVEDWRLHRRVAEPHVFRSWRPLLVSLPIAAAILALVILPLAWLPMARIVNQAVQQDDVAPEPILIARLAEAFECRWADQQPVWIGKRFASGQDLTLQEGVARIVLDNGVEVVLEGPLTCRLESLESCWLDRGQLTVKVPAEAHGFKIATVAAEIVDLGTEFGVACAESGVVDVVVFDGEVRVASPLSPAEPVSVTAGQAVRVDISGQLTAEQNGSRNVFARRVPKWEYVAVANPGFEQAGAGEQPLAGWTMFGTAGGNILRESEPRVQPRSGSSLAKVFGRFEDEQSFSGLYQELPTLPGQPWRMIAYVAHPSGDQLAGGNRALAKLDFVDTDGELIAGQESAKQLTADSPPDEFVRSIVEAAAPAGAARVRLVLLFDQDAANSPGAALFDDVVLLTVSPAAGKE